MTVHEIIEAAGRLGEEELQELDFWIRDRLDPAAAELEHHGVPDATAAADEEDVHYRLKYFRCGKESCRCRRGQLHGPYLYVQRRGPNGRTHTTYMGRIPIVRQDEDRQLELEFR